jgi:Metallo-peptidase family M12B Reprolysin-like
VKTILLKNSFNLSIIAFAVMAINPAVKADDVLIKEQPHKIYHVVKAKTLAQATDQIANRSGIHFKINAANQSDIINQKLAAEDWKTALSQLLNGYNYTTNTVNGVIKTVIITGTNGKHDTSNITTVNIQPSNTLPNAYKHFNLGSVMPVNLPLAKMNATQVGKKLSLDLPIGQYQVNHDDLVKHADGSSTWMGYLDDEGKGYRVYLSQGEAGLMGNVYTPDGAYNIETVDGQTYMVDLEDSGLQSAGYDHDQAEVNHADFNLPIINIAPSIPETAAATLSTGTSTTTTTTSSTCTTGSTVDLMVVYTTAKQTALYAKQRIKYLVDISNRAYRDSKISMCLRLVHTRPTKYVDNNSNNQALVDLANDKGAFYGTAAARTKYGADLVMLFRPLYAQVANGCGVTYVNFSNGSGASAKYGYGTISNGYSKDSLTNKYCDESTFTHEIGHSLGTVHDLEYSNFPGKFAYSYAYGIQGKFATIMSYKSPKLMLFSTPKLTTQCKGIPCGNSTTYDQSRTINYTSPIIAKFKAKTVTTPVLQ